MKISPHLKMDILKVLVITMCYTGINVFASYFIYAIFNSPFCLGPSPLYSLRENILINICIGILAGTIGGSMLLYINRRLFRTRSFGFAMFVTELTYLLLFCFIVAMTILYATYQLVGHFPNWHEIKTIGFQTISPHLIIAYYLLWGKVTFLTLFLLQVIDKYGPETFIKFVMGKYHRANRENRLFMFMDMRSSTAIAEKIGNEKYFDLLRKLFTDITPAVLNHKGEIYQYVGDEIVLTWPINKMVKRGQFIHCFMEVRSILEKKRDIYAKQFGVFPEFKAGVHYGSVMAGEVGVIKKEIIFSGDVLNTAARIQEYCNQFKQDLIISQTTMDLVEHPLPYQTKALGAFTLRGKAQDMELQAVEMS